MVESQSWKEICDAVGGPEEDPVVYDFSEKAGKKFTERKEHGAYDGDNE